LFGFAAGTNFLLSTSQNVYKCLLMLDYGRKSNTTTKQEQTKGTFGTFAADDACRRVAVALTSTGGTVLLIEGVTDGASDGTTDGTPDGTVDGTRVDGACVGEPDGSMDAVAVGREEGCSDGACDGDEVGEIGGSRVDMYPYDFVG